MVPSFSSSTIDNPLRPHSGRSYFIGMDIAGIGGNVADIRPIGEFKQFIPMKGFRPRKEGLQTLGVRFQGSFITGWGGKTAPPFERFFQGGDTDLRGFDIRSASPTALIADKVTVNLTNPDGTLVLADPTNPRVGPWQVTVPISRLVYPGGDTSLVSNVEYRIPIVGPVTFALFADTGMNMAVRQSQLRLSDQQFNATGRNPIRLPGPSSNHRYKRSAHRDLHQGTQFLKFSQNLTPLAHTNYVVRMSTGAELQVILPVVNAPFRLFYAYNPLRVDTEAPAPTLLHAEYVPGKRGGRTTRT